MTDEKPEDKERNHENDLEISASLKEFKFLAGGNWRQYLGPWIGPIVLVAIIGFAAGVVILAIYSAKVLLP